MTKYLEELMSSHMVYDGFCIRKECPDFKRWKFEYGNCTSCKRMDDTYVVKEYPKDCRFFKEIQEAEIIARLKGEHHVV